MRLLAVFAVCWVLTAQEPSISVNVNLVQIDVTVTDKKGNRVSNLTAADFELSQNGKRQSITSAVWIPGPTRPVITPAAAPGLPPPAPRAQDIRRTVAILIDDLTLSFSSVHYTRTALKEFIEKNIEPGDLVALYKTSSSLGVLPQLTTDKRQLLASVNRLTFRNLNQTDSRAPIQNNASEDSGNPAIAEMALRMRLQEESMNKTRQDVFTAGSLGSAQFIVKGLRDLPGRKSLVFFSESLQLYDLPAALVNPNMSAAAAMSPAAQGGIRTRTVQAIRALADFANRSNVVIYTIDPRGLVHTGFTAADVPSTDLRRMMGQQQQRSLEFNLSKDGLAMLAEETGGIFYQNRNDLGDALKDAVQDQEGYYLLGFNPDDDTFKKNSEGAKFHNLRVKVKPDGLKVRYRHGFMGIEDADRFPPAASPVLAALMAPFRATQIPLRLTPQFYHEKDKGSFLRSLVHIDPSGFTFTETPADPADKDQTPWSIANFQIAVYLFGDTGVTEDRVSQAQRLRIRGNGAAEARKYGIVQQLDLPMKRPGPYQLRAAVVDSANKNAGSASQFVEIPDIKKSRLILSDLVIAGEKTENSPAMRQFGKGEKVHYGAYVYNAKAKNVLAQISIYRDGKLIHRGSKDSVSAERITGTLALATNAPVGTYALELAIQDDKQFAVRTLDFTVQ